MLPFFDSTELRVGTKYLLMAYVGGEVISSGEYYLVSQEPVKHNRHPRLGFSRLPDHAPQVFLKEAHTQFGSDTWRHAIKTEHGWDVFWPIGAGSWNEACVCITIKP